jgi:3-deoxy-D-manno-octulosonic-acid transferase
LNTIQVLNKNPEQYERASQNASQFIQQNAGATLKTIQWIQEKQLLFP